MLREQLQQYESEEVVNHYANDMDAFDQLIFGKGVRIVAVHIHQDLNLLLIVLNNKQVIQRSLSTYSSLQHATQDQLHDFAITGEGTGIHWPAIDEDLSLKSFLKEELLSDYSKKEK